MQLNIFSLKGIDYQGEIKSLTAKTLAGEITILNHHRPLISILKSGSLRIIDLAGIKNDIQVTSGFLEVSPDNTVNILLD